MSRTHYVVFILKSGAMIPQYKPEVITRYPLARMLPGDPFYNANAEKLFANQWARYRQARV